MTIGNWIHNICLVCWVTREGTFRIPRRLVIAHVQADCCYCGKPNQDGIFVRQNPNEVQHPKELVHVQTPGTQRPQ